MKIELAPFHDFGYRWILTPETFAEEAQIDVLIRRCAELGTDHYVELAKSPGNRPPFDQVRSLHTFIIAAPQQRSG